MTSSEGTPPLDFNPFRVLGVTASTPAEELKKAFHKRIRLSHPDKVTGKEALATSLNQAYDLLKDTDLWRRLELERAYSGQAPGHSSTVKPMLTVHAHVFIGEPPIFPRLIWDMILGKMDDAKDVSNMAIAIPELDPLVRRKLPMLLFDEVIPHVLPWMFGEDILASRLVCRGWSRGLDQFLQNNLDFDHRVAARAKRLYSAHGHYLKKGLTFSSPDTFGQFIRDMENHPAERSPFVCSKITFQHDDDDLDPDDEDVIPDSRRYWDGAQQLLQTFGHHLVHLWIAFPKIEENPGSHCQFLLNSFQHLPNLKHFRITGGFRPIFTDDPHSRQFRNGVMQAVNNFIGSGATLPSKLESLYIAYTAARVPFFNFLLSELSPQLRQLELSFDRVEKGLPKQSLPQLKELKLRNSQVILNYFKHLPNLQHLTFGAGYIPNYIDDPETRSFRSGATLAVIDFMESGLPPPANLHSLKIIFRGCPLPLANLLLSWLSSQLRKLVLLRYDEPKGFPTMILPNLNDLTILDSIPKNFLRDLIRKLVAPQISKLELILKNEWTEYVMETDIFPFLKKFPQLESLTLTCGGEYTALMEEETLSPSRDSILSLKSLTITGNNPELNYDFLRCFPSLKTLAVNRESSLQGWLRMSLMEDYTTATSGRCFPIWSK